MDALIGVTLGGVQRRLALWQVNARGSSSSRRSLIVALRVAVTVGFPLVDS
jgi:hypothetical protein